MKKLQIIFLAIIAIILLSFPSHNIYAGGAVGEVVECTQDYTKSSRFLAPIRIYDAKSGDNLTQGLPATAYYLFDGGNWDRARGDTTYGLDVDVTRVPSNIDVTGSSTPTDTYANPSTAIDVWSLLGLYNGSTWDMARGDITYGLDVDITRMPASGSIMIGASTPADAYANPADAIDAWSLMGLYNGSTWDMVRGDTTNGLDVDVTRLPAVFGASTPIDTYTTPTDALDVYSLLGFYNGSNWDMARGDITYGLDVDITRIPAIVGASTPIDTYTTPTDALDVYSLLGFYNGSSWDMARGDIANGLDVDVTRLPAIVGASTPADTYTTPTDSLDVYSLLGYYNGSNWDMARGDITNGLDVDITRTVALSNDSNIINASTDTDVKSSGGTLNKIIVSVAGTGSTVAIYNDSDGTCSSGLTFTLPTTTAGVIHNIEHQFSTGICAKTADGGGAATISILFR